MTTDTTQTAAEQIALADDDGRPYGDRWKQPAFLEFARIAQDRGDFFDFVASVFYSQKCALCRTVQGIALVLAGPLMFWAAHGFLAGMAVAAFWLLFWLSFRSAVFAVNERERRGKAAAKAVGDVMKEATRDAMETARDEVARATLATAVERGNARELGVTAPVQHGPAAGNQHPLTGAPSTGAPGGQPVGAPDPGVEPAGDDLAGLPAAARAPAPARTTTQTTATVTVVGNAPQQPAHQPRPQDRASQIHKPGQGPAVTVTTGDPGQNSDK